MKFILIFALIGTAMGIYLIDEARLFGAGLGFIGGAIIGLALRAFPREEPDDGDPIIEDDHHDHHHHA